MSTWIKFRPEDLLLDSDYNLLQLPAQALCFRIFCQLHRGDFLPADPVRLGRVLGGLDRQTVAKWLPSLLGVFVVEQEGRLVARRTFPGRVIDHPEAAPSPTPARPQPTPCPTPAQAQPDPSPGPAQADINYLQSFQDGAALEVKENNNSTPLPPTGGRGRRREPDGLRVLTAEERGWLDRSEQDYPREAPDGRAVHRGTRAERERAWARLLAADPALTARELRACAVLLLRDQEQQGVKWRYGWLTVFGPVKAPWRDYLAEARLGVAAAIAEEVGNAKTA